jgi:hypothetical protein
VRLRFGPILHITGQTVFNALSDATVTEKITGVIEDDCPYLPRRRTHDPAHLLQVHTEGRGGAGDDGAFEGGDIGSLAEYIDVGKHECFARMKAPDGPRPLFPTGSPVDVLGPDARLVERVRNVP